MISAVNIQDEFEHFPAVSNCVVMGRADEDLTLRPSHLSHQPIKHLRQ